MQQQKEPISKQHILAEDTLGNPLIPSLSNLFVSHYQDCAVLAVFSCIEKKLLAYKITHPITDLNEREHWLSDDFNRIISVSFAHTYELVPHLFSDNVFNGQNIVNQLMVCYATDQPEHSIHYTTALIRFHLIKQLSHQIYLSKTDQYYHILLMNQEECLLANAFECENEHEVLYFLLNALQISDILPSDTTLNMDYSLVQHPSLVQFLSPHFAKSEMLQYTSDHLNTSIPHLPEKLFSSYAASLCV